MNAGTPYSELPRINPVPTVSITAPVVNLALLTPGRSPEHMSGHQSPQGAVHVGPPGVHVVITGNHEHTMRRVELRERGRIHLDVLGAVIDQITRDRNHIRAQCGHIANHARQEGARPLRANV